MKHFIKNLIALNVLLIILLSAACNKQPYKPKSYSAKAYVLGEEKCSTDKSYNYWLLDLSVETNTPHYGDTVFFNGIKYYNVLKTINLDSSLRKTGKKISFDFRYSSFAHDTVRSANCDNPNAETFALARIILSKQSELQ